MHFLLFIFSQKKTRDFFETNYKLEVEIKKKTENNILHMPKSKKFINLEDDEDYRLRFGVYQDLLDDLEDSNDEN